MHQPYFRNGKNSNVAFLFVHGILSSPRHFDWLIQQIPEEYAISNILLAGHGGNVEDFSRANMQQWKNQFECTLTELKKSYRSIIVVGHSLGSLLALHASTSHKSISGGMLLLNPPLQPQLMPSMMWRSIRFAFDKVHLDDPNDISCYCDMGITLDPYLWKYLKWIPNFISLLTLAHHCRTIPKGLTIPCFACFGLMDEVVNPRSQRYFQNNSQITVTVFPDGDHFGFTDLQKGIISQHLDSLVTTIISLK